MYLENPRRIAYLEKKTSELKEHLEIIEKMNNF